VRGRFAPGLVAVFFFFRKKTQHTRTLEAAAMADVEDALWVGGYRGYVVGLLWWLVWSSGGLHS